MRVNLRWSGPNEYIADIELENRDLVARVYAHDGVVRGGLVFLPDGETASIDSWPQLGTEIRRAVKRRAARRRSHQDMAREIRGGRR
jgi:hypothetical protein